MEVLRTFPNFPPKGLYFRFFTLFLVINYCPSTIDCGWGYVDQSGWSALHDTSCGGRHQSPIDLPNVCSPQNSNVTMVNPQLNLRLINYDMQMPPSVLTLRNNGHTAVVSLRDSRRPNAWLPKISGSVVGGDKYQLLQLHFHWDSNKNSHIGSEHALHGTRRAFEMHLVHYNTKYQDPVEAGLHPDGFSVLGTFFDDAEDDEYNNQELNKIVLQLREISEFNTTVDMKRSINLRQLLPRDIDTFYTYQGSLTTPPCSEIITWIIFPEAQKIGPQQLFNFERALDTYSDQTGSKEVMSETCRDLQPLNDRIVYSSSNSHCSGSVARPATSLVLENLPNSIVSSLSNNNNRGQQQQSRQPQNSRDYDNNNNNNYRPNSSGANYNNGGSQSGQQQQQSDRYYYNNGRQQQNGQQNIDRSPGRGQGGGRVEIVYGGTRNPTVSRRPGLVGGLVGGLLG